MRKITSIIILLVVFLGGCNTPTQMSDQGTAATQPDSPTAAPTHVEFPVFVTENPAPTLQAVPDNPNDVCENPYYPVVNGAQWTTRSTIASDGSISISTQSMEVYEDKSFTLTMTGNSSTFKLDGRCTDDGIILMDVPGISGTFSSTDGDGSTMTTENVDGVTLPNDVQIGDDWSQEISLVAKSNSGDTVLSATIETSYVALGYETVTVPAGAFYALKVEQTGSMTMGGGEPFLSHGFIWYAQGIGTVKSGLDGTFMAELTQYSIP